MSATPAYPKKLFYRINEVAEILGVEPYVLRYWESRFSMLKPERMGNDERRYRQRDIELLLRIRTLLYEQKYTIAGAVERLQRGDSPEPPMAPLPPLVEEPADVQMDIYAMAVAAEQRDEIGRARESLSLIRKNLAELRDALAN